jgi:CheY-like chemotaxis protein
MTILYVEDDELTRLTIAQRLRRRGLDVIDVASGEQALDVALNAGNLSAVLLDISLPGIDGVDTYRHLRQMYPGLAAVVMSASLSADVRQSFLDLGVLDRNLLEKPCQFSHLQGALQTIQAEVETIRPMSKEACHADDNLRVHRCGSCPDGLRTYGCAG